MPPTRTAHIAKPTRWTVFLRTFIPWQLWRFAMINLRMLDIIRRSHERSAAAARAERVARTLRSGTSRARST